MPENPLPPDAERLAERREYVRRSVLRANRAIGVILALVVLLGVVLVMMIQRARRSQARAEHAEDSATERLWKASLAQARAENLSTQMGHRGAALEAVRTAAGIRPSTELRNEAIAALAQRDFTLEKSWTTHRNPYGFGFDPDLKYYLVRYEPKVLSLYRMEDDAHVRDFPLPLFLHLREGVNVGDFQFSGSGRHVIIRYNGGPVTIFETETAKIVRMIGMDPRVQQWSWPPTCTADDRLLCMNMAGPGGEAVLYDIGKGEVRELPQWPAELKWAGGATQVAVSPAGDRLAWYQGADISILDATSGAVLQTTKAPAPVSAFRWDEQGGRLAFHSDNFALSVWDLKSDRVTQMGGTAIRAWQQRFSQDGRMLLTAGQDGMTRLWDVATARLICQTNSARGMEFNRAGDRVAWGITGKGTGTWRIAQPEATRYFQGTMRERTTMWQQDITEDAALAVWTPARWAPPLGFDLLDLNGDGIFHQSTPGKLTMGFLPGQQRRLWMTDEGKMKLVDLPPGGLPQNADWMQQAESLPLPAGFYANGASWSADGRWVAVSGANAALLVLDTTAPEKPVILERGYGSHDSIQGPGSSTGSGAMSISPDGRWVAAGRYTEGLLTIVWDAKTGKIVQRLPDLYNNHVAFSPDGRWLFIAGTNGAALWSTGTWERRWLQPRPAMLDTQSVGCFTGDSHLVAWSRGVTQVDLMDMEGRQVAALDFPELGYVAGLRFAAGGRKLFVSGTEGRMLTVDLPALRSQLAGMKLDWQVPDSSKPETATVPAPSGLTAWSPAFLGILPVILAGVMGVLVLRRQGRLTREFIQATEVASQRGQELAAEKEVSELKSRFVTTVSHEFRTPLGITMSAVELLRHYEDRLPREEKTQLFDDIHTATRNMAGLMEQVLVLGRVDAGKLACNPVPCDLEAFAHKLIDESLSATNRKCPVEWTAENALSGAHADEALLRHIFTNLLSNAVKYSPAGAPVHFCARREGLMAVFTVQDSGIGIPEADLPTLFEAFHRASNVGDIPGTGLGLVISKRCAELHGGSIQVKSRPGEGTTFTIRIPAWE